MKKDLKLVAKLLRKIISIIHFRIYLYKLKYCGAKKCLFISNGMGYGGAPLVLVEAMTAYRDMGYYVILFSEYYGPLINKCRGLGIVTLIYPNINSRRMEQLSSIKFDFAFVNTTPEYKWIPLLEKKETPVIWWLHEGISYIEPIKKSLPRKVSNSTLVLTVSPRTVDALRTCRIEYETNMLFYGLQDLAFNSNTDKVEKTSKFVFLLMGAICERKNQIFAVDAFLSLPQEIQREMELRIVGSPLISEENYFEQFKKNIKDRMNIIYISSVSRKDIPELYKSIDALICCSIDDPLPVVITEAAMFSKKIILSSETGQYDLFDDERSAYKYDTYSKEMLMNCMIKAFSERNSVSLGNEARKIYKRYFSIGAFRNSLIKYTKSLHIHKED